MTLSCSPKMDPKRPRDTPSGDSLVPPSQPDGPLILSRTRCTHSGVRVSESRLPTYPRVRNGHRRRTETPGGGDGRESHRSQRCPCTRCPSTRGPAGTTQPHSRSPSSPDAATRETLDGPWEEKWNPETSFVPVHS